MFILLKLRERERREERERGRERDRERERYEHINNDVSARLESYKLVLILYTDNFVLYFDRLVRSLREKVIREVRRPMVM